MKTQIQLSPSLVAVICVILSFSIIWLAEEPSGKLRVESSKTEKNIIAVNSEKV